MVKQYSFGGTDARDDGDEGMRGAVKTCPRCGARLFEDMDVCYGCLYDFRNPGGGFTGLPDPDGPQTGGVPAGRRASPSLGQSVRMGEGRTGEGPARREATGSPGGVEDPSATLAFGSAPAPVSLRVSSASVEVVLPLGDGGLSFGRSPDNDVVLPARTASREHLRVVRRGDDVMAFDQGATNPALLNGEAISGGVRLAEGDVIEMGDVVVRLEAAV